MRMTTMAGQLFPPRLADVLRSHPNFHMDLPGDLQMTCANDNEACSFDSVRSSFYAAGSSRFNSHVGHLAWTTMFLRFHNSICDMLLRDKPDFSDQEVRSPKVLLLAGALTFLLCRFKTPACLA